MPRVRFGALPGRSAGGAEITVRKPQQAPPGYTANTVITEWLTLNCHGDWGSVSDGPFVRVRFAEAEDCARARVRFG
jgi:hypothetical protein